MFAVVRTGGKQYRVAAGDKIVVEKMAGEAGDNVSLGDVLFAGEGAELKSTDGLTVSAEIIAQAKADKVIIFKKRRRHNYRRKNGHRQQHTILRILAIGDEKPVKAPAKKAEAKVEAAPAPEKNAPVARAAAEKPAPAKKAAAEKPAAEKKAPVAKKAAADKAPVAEKKPAAAKKPAAKKAPAKKA